MNIVLVFFGPKNMTFNNILTQKYRTYLPVCICAECPPGYIVSSLFASLIDFQSELFSIHFHSFFFVQEIFSILRKNHISAASSCFFIVSLIVHVSHPYIIVLHVVLHKSKFSFIVTISCRVSTVDIDLNTVFAIPILQSFVLFLDLISHLMLLSSLNIQIFLVA